MATEKRNQLSEIMHMAWTFVRKNGYSMSEALKQRLGAFFNAPFFLILFSS